MRTSTVAWALTLLVTLSFSSRSAAEQPAPLKQDKLVSTFPLVLDGAFSKTEASAFEDLIRSEATTHLSPFGYKVLTGETTLQVLQDNGLSLEQIAKACDDSACLLSTAKELKVKLFISGSVRRLEDETVSVFIRIFDGDNGSLLSSTSELQGARLRDAKESFAKNSQAFFERALSAVNDPDVKARLAEVRRERELAAAREREQSRPATGLPQENPIFDLGGRLVLRGGLGGTTGVLGGGVEWHFSRLALAVGIGSYLTGGVTIKPLGYGKRGGLYVDVHLARSLSGTIKDTGVGATVGWDFRPIPWITLKGGIGGAWTTAAKDSDRVRPLVLDLSGGLVF